jgi:hypothetical protein
VLTYEPLEKYLIQQPGDSVVMTFAEVERLIGTKLPPSAHKRNEWWSNNPTNHSQAKAWLDAGFETANLDRKAKRVVFKRVSRTAGMQEAPRMFKPAENERKRVARHPAIGAMKGTFTIEPGYDLAQSPFSQEELDEMEANLDRTADMVDARMSKKR